MFKGLFPSLAGLLAKHVFQPIPLPKQQSAFPAVRLHGTREDRLHRRSRRGDEKRQARRDQAARMGDAFGRTVESLTNYERSRWAAAGYPGLRKRLPDPVRTFVGLAQRRCYPTT